MESPGTSEIREGGDHPVVDTAGQCLKLMKRGSCVLLGSEGEKKGDNG